MIQNASKGSGNPLHEPACSTSAENEVLPCSLEHAVLGWNREAQRAQSCRVGVSRGHSADTKDCGTSISVQATHAIKHVPAQTQPRGCQPCSTRAPNFRCLGLTLCSRAVGRRGLASSLARGAARARAQRLLHRGGGAARISCQLAREGHS